MIRRSWCGVREDAEEQKEPMTWRRFKVGKTSEDVDAVVRSVVQSASRHIPAYRRLISDAGVSVADFRGASDLPILPVVKKESVFHDLPLREQMNVRVSIARSVRTNTSGFTGMPISIYMSRAEALFRKLQILLAWRRVAKLPHLLRVADLGNWVAKDAGHETLRRGVIWVLRVSPKLPMNRQTRLVTAFDPHVISGPATALELLGDGVIEEGNRLRSVRLIASRGEVLFKAVREGLERRFGCQVADFYNCEEIGNVAAQCPMNPDVFHVNTDACIVEIVADDGGTAEPGEEGKILLTNLYNCTMPLIRYDMADRGALLSPSMERRCLCGSERPRMRLVGGREDDYVFLPSGRRMSPRLIGTAVYRAAMASDRNGGVRWLFRGFQVTQDAPDHITVRVIPQVGNRGSLERRIAAALNDIDPGFQTTVIRVPELPLEASGKFRKVICKIDSVGRPRGLPPTPIRMKEMDDYKK